VGAEAAVTLQAIETRYHGCRFRSRLEARWAVFLDAAAVSWEYEAEGFHLDETYYLARPDGIYYLPDFWLPKSRQFLEVKPKLSGRERVKVSYNLIPALLSLASASGSDVFLIEGSPRQEDELLEDVFNSPKITCFSRGKNIRGARLFECPYCGRVSFRKIEGSMWKMWCECRGGPNNAFEDETYDPYTFSPRIKHAMQQAQWARFEHGEDGKPEPFPRLTPRR
jgi:hypothetical protein